MEEEGDGVMPLLLSKEIAIDLRDNIRGENRLEIRPA